MDRTLEDIRANLDHVGCDNQTALQMADEIAQLRANLLRYKGMYLRDMARKTEEIERLRAALDQIIAIDHYPDATIARKARGLPTTDREALEQTADGGADGKA